MNKPANSADDDEKTLWGRNFFILFYFRADIILSEIYKCATWETKDKRQYVWSGRWYTTKSRVDFAIFAFEASSSSRRRSDEPRRRLCWRFGAIKSNKNILMITQTMTMCQPKLIFFILSNLTSLLATNILYFENASMNNKKSIPVIATLKPEFGQSRQYFHSHFIDMFALYGMFAASTGDTTHVVLSLAEIKERRTRLAMDGVNWMKRKFLFEYKLKNLRFRILKIHSRIWNRNKHTKKVSENRLWVSRDNRRRRLVMKKIAKTEAKTEEINESVRDFLCSQRCKQTWLIAFEFGLRLKLLELLIHFLVRSNTDHHEEIFNSLLMLKNEVWSRILASFPTLSTHPRITTDP